MRRDKSISEYLMISFLLIPFSSLFSQEGKKADFSAAADFYSSYIFRGTKYGTGPAVQPLVKLTSGFFTAGGWGSFDFNGYEEADLFFSFSLPAGFTLGMTDYYYPGLDYFDYSTETGSHAMEINAGYVNGGLAVSANYILNEAGGIGSAGGDFYCQAGYSFSDFNILAGAGNGWHTSDGGFNLCNIGAGTVRTIKVSDTFSVPVTGQIILNPERQKLYLVVGFTL